MLVSVVKVHDMVLDTLEATFLLPHALGTKLI